MGVQEFCVYYEFIIGMEMVLGIEIEKILMCGSMNEYF